MKPFLSAVVAVVAIAGVADAGTVVTKYTYNADGALTAVTKQFGESEPQTTYLTWDNFVPEASDPTHGQVLQRNGRLTAIGPEPGTASATEQFGFDVRDRLTSYSGSNGSETFEYYAGGGMAVSSTDADALSFYYDDSPHAQVTNIHASMDDLWSAYLHKVRFLSDGTQQVLFKPRKDVACTYDADGEALQSYVYDTFGASPLVPAGDKYDLTQNPFRYTGEYRDPVWGGYYLRSRWYHPELPIFLSRDSARHLSRYGYGGGNPVMRTDPSGESYMSKIGRPLGRFLKKANRGVIGHVWRVFFAPLAGPLQIAADPKGFWNAVKTNRSNIDVFLALGVATEAVGGYLDAGLLRYGVSYGRRFLLRAGLDVALGAGQSVSAAASRGFHHFDWNTFVQGMEYTASTIGYRGLASFNVRKAKLPSAGVQPVANNVGRAAEESSVLSSSRSAGIVRGSFDETVRSDDNLLSIADEDELDRFITEQETYRQQQDFLAERRQAAKEATHNSMRKVLKRGVRAFGKNKKFALPKISRQSGLGSIAEDQQLGFENQAQIHSNNMIEDLESE
jgi:RHS repeat-associated protein